MERSSRAKTLAQGGSGIRRCDQPTLRRGDVAKCIVATATDDAIVLKFTQFTK